MLDKTNMLDTTDDQMYYLSFDKNFGYKFSYVFTTRVWMFCQISAFYTIYR